jgi:hypothetical protein
MGLVAPGRWTEARVRTPTTRPPLSPARGRPCGPHGALTHAHLGMCTRTASGAHLPRLATGLAREENRSVENGNTPAPLRWWLSPYALPPVAPTHGRTSEHACPPCCSPCPTRPTVACLCRAAAHLRPADHPRHSARLRLPALLRPPALARLVGTACAW